MTEETAVVAPKANWRLEKRDAAGEVFEVVEGGDDKETRVVFRRPGEPPESYAQIEEPKSWE